MFIKNSHLLKVFRLATLLYQRWAFLWAMQASPFIASLLILSSCSYRFSNLHMRAPAGSKSIAIEAIYDTSHQVLPHEYIWESIQRQFANDGRLELRSQENADLYMRVHLKNASFAPNNLFYQTAKDPVSFERADLLKEGFISPYPLSAYSRYRRAMSFYRSNIFSMSLKAEVWDLRTRQMIFERSYGLGGTYSTDPGGSPLEYGFLRVEENFENLFAGKAAEFAKNVVSDFLRSHKR